MGGCPFTKGSEWSQCGWLSVSDPRLELYLIALTEVGHHLCQCAQTNCECLYTAVHHRSVHLLVPMLDRNNTCTLEQAIEIIMCYKLNKHGYLNHISSSTDGQMEAWLYSILA